MQDRSPALKRAPFTAALSLAMVAGTYPPFALGALAPFLVEDLGLTRTQLGTITTALFLMGAALSVFAGRLVDRVGGRLMLGATFTLGALTLLALARAPAYGWLLAAGLLGGVAMAASNPVTNQLVSEHIPRGGQGAIMGVKQSAVQLGAFLAGGTLPSIALLRGWRTAMAAGAVLPLAGLVLSGVAVPRDPDAPDDTTARRPRTPRVRMADTDRHLVIWLALYAALMGAGVATVGAYLPLYGVEALGLSARSAGLVASLVGLVGVASRILWARRSERRATVRGPLRTIASASVAGVGLLWAASVAGTPIVWVGAVIFGATAISWNAVGMLAIVREVARPSTGVASGVVLLGFYVGFIVAPVTFGWSVDRTGGYDTGWLGLAVVFTVAATVAHLRPGRGA